MMQETPLIQVQAPAAEPDARRRDDREGHEFTDEEFENVVELGLLPDHGRDAIHQESTDDETGAGVILDHTALPLMPMFKPKEWGGTRRMVPVQNARGLVEAGWTRYCPFCRKRSCSTRPNECPAKQKQHYAACPICGKHVYDTEGRHEGTSLAENLPPHIDPMQIALPRADPQARVLAKVAAHMRAFHPQESFAYPQLRDIPGPSAEEERRALMALRDEAP